MKTVNPVEFTPVLGFSEIIFQKKLQKNLAEVIFFLGLHHDIQ